jgi:hypothetical protein
MSSYDDPSYTRPAQSGGGTIELGTSAAEMNQAALRSIVGNLQLQTEEIRKKRGQASGVTLALIQDAMPTYIDFQRGPTYNINLPSGTPAISVYAMLYSIELVNIGSGTVYYSVNLPYNEGGTRVLLNGARVMFEAKTAKYKSVTVRAVGANATVNIGWEV